MYQLWILTHARVWGHIHLSKLRFPNIAHEARCLKMRQNTSIEDPAAIRRWLLWCDQFLGPPKMHYSGTWLYFFSYCVHIRQRCTMIHPIQRRAYKNQFQFAWNNLSEVYLHTDELIWTMIKLHALAEFSHKWWLDKALMPNQLAALLGHWLYLIMQESHRTRLHVKELASLPQSYSSPTTSSTQTAATGCSLNTATVYT